MQQLPAQQHTGHEAEDLKSWPVLQRAGITESQTKQAHTHTTRNASWFVLIRH